jgi:nitrous oxide reductase accessory protein NosL
MTLTNSRSARFLLSLGTLAVQLALAVTLALSSGCGGKARPRCERCGMFTDANPRWTAGAIAAGGRDVHFDAPRCMFAWLQATSGIGAEGPWVTEYYSQRKRPAAFVWYVVGSDVVGPMGPDLVPVGDEAAAERFRVEHQGRQVLRYDAVDAAALARLDAH